MDALRAWVRRAWLPYLLAGAAWIVAGAVVLGDPRGQGLIFVGLSCLSLGGYGAADRIAHRFRHETRAARSAKRS